MADESRMHDRALEVLDRIAQGDMYGYVCAHGSEVVKAAKEGAEAIRYRQRLDELLKCWEELDGQKESM